MYADAVAALNAAITSLSAEEYRAARLMLDIADAQNGHLYLTREEACDLFCVQSWASVRRMLGHLADVGVIEFHTNNRAYVLFPQYEEPRTTGAPEITTGADRAPQDHQRARGARQDGPNKELNTGSGSGSGRVNLPTLPGEPEGVQGEPAATRETLTPEQTRSYWLLTDDEIGATEQLALELALAHPFDEIRRQAVQFLRDRHSGKVDHAGVLRYRLSARPPVAITDRDRASPFWQRHAPPDEDEEDRRRKYIPDEYRDIIIG